LGYDAAPVDIGYTGLDYRYLIDQPLKALEGIIFYIVPGNRDHRHGVFLNGTGAGRDEETGPHIKFPPFKDFQVFIKMFRLFPKIRCRDLIGGKSLQTFYQIRDNIETEMAEDCSIGGTSQYKTGSRDGSVPGFIYRTKRSPILPELRRVI
jgi:hypothetical protein